MTRDELREYRDIRRESEQIRTLLADLRGRMTAPKVPHLGGDPGGRSGDGCALERVIDRCAELELFYTNKLNDLSARQLAIEQAVDSLPSRLRMIIRAHYIQGISWERISTAAGCGPRHVFKLRAQALQILESE